MASEGQQTKMPNKDTNVEFETHNTKLPCPFVIYGDLECLTTNSNTEVLLWKQCSQRNLPKT